MNDRIFKRSHALRRANLLLAGLVALVCLAPARAHAGGFFLVTYGDSFKYLGEVPAAQKETIQQTTGKDPQIGYKYSYAGLFWIDIWTWGGEYCLYKDKTYWSLDRYQAAALLGVEEAALLKPWTYRYPPGLLIIGLVVLLVTVSVIQGSRNMRKADELLTDPRYKRALEMLGAGIFPEGGKWSEWRKQVMEQAVEYLVSEGIEAPRARADVNLLELVHGPREPTPGAPASPPVPPAAPGENLQARAE
jgi:hypothetical protein